MKFNLPTFAVTKNTIKLGPVSVNIRNGEVHYDRRTLKGKSTAVKATALVGAAVATAIVATKLLKK